MEPGSKVTAPSSDSDDDLESLLTTTEFPWELSDSDEDYEQAWLEGEKMDDDVVAKALAATMLGANPALRESALGAGMSSEEPTARNTSIAVEDDAVKQWVFPETDTEANILRNADGSIKFISIQRFYAKILDQNDLDTVLKKYFYDTWMTFTNKRQIFSVLSRIIEESVPDSTPDKKGFSQQGLLRFLQDWIDQYPDQFVRDQELFESMLKFINNAVLKHLPAHKNNLQMALDRSSEPRRVAANSEPPASILPKKAFTLLQADATEICRQLILMSQSHFSKLSSFEIMSYTLGQKLYTPNLNALVKIFNGIGELVQQSILAQEKEEKRAKMFSKWLKVADVARKEFAVDTLMAVLSGLNGMPTFRLAKTRDKLTASHRRRLETLNELISQTKSFANLRRFQSSSTGKCLPYVGVCLVDLTFINDGNPPTEAESNRINVRKLQLFSDCMADTLKWQSSSYNLIPVAAMNQLLTPIEGISADELYAVSIYLEPRNGAPSPATKPNTLVLLTSRFLTEAIIANDKITKLKSKSSFRSRSSGDNSSS